MTPEEQAPVRCAHFWRHPNLPDRGDGGEPIVCALDEGHDGWHGSRGGTQWVDGSEYDHVPGKYLSPNGDQKRIPALVARDKRQMRGDVCLGLLADDSVKAVGSPFQSAHLLMELRWCKRWRDREVYLPDDPSNAAYALKAAVDGVVDAGLLPDDSGEYVRVLSTSVTRVPTRDEEGLLVVLTELADDPAEKEVGA